MLALGAAVGRAHRARPTTASRRVHHSIRRQRRTSRSSASGPAPEQKNFQAVLDAFKKKFPGVKVKYTSAGDNTPTVLSTAVAGGNPPDLAAVAQPGLVQEFSGRKAIKPIDYVKPLDGQVATRRRGSSSAPSTASSTAWSSRAPTSRPSGTSSRPSRTPASTPPKTWPAAPGGGQDAAGLRHPRVLDRRSGRLDRSPTCSRTSTCARRARRSTTSSRCTRSSGPIRRSRRALKTMAQRLQRHRQHLRRHHRRAPDRLPDLGQQRLQRRRRRPRW